LATEEARTRDHVLQQELIRMSAFELRLPAMMMRVDEPRANNLIGGIDYF